MIFLIAGNSRCRKNTLPDTSLPETDVAGNVLPETFCRKQRCRKCRCRKPTDRPNHWPDFMVKMDEECHMNVPSRKRLFPPKISVTKKMGKPTNYNIGSLVNFDKIRNMKRKEKKRKTKNKKRNFLRNKFMLGLICPCTSGLMQFFGREFTLF